MNTNKSKKSDVCGLRAKIVEQKAVQTFLKGESEDPAQIIERFEERAECEEEE